MSRKSRIPSCAGRIDRLRQIVQMIRMSRLDSIYTMIKALVCVAFVLALVLLPPSSAHASSGMHGGIQGGEHPVTDLSDHSAHQGHDMSSSLITGATCGSTADFDGQDHTGGKCCSGMCSSVVLDDVHPVFVGLTTGDRFIPLQARATSVDPSGFLRPPQYLI